MGKQKTKYVRYFHVQDLRKFISNPYIFSTSESLELPQEGVPTRFHRTSTNTCNAEYQDSQGSDEDQ